jgi:hypothetical protein
MSTLRTPARTTLAILLILAVAVALCASLWASPDSGRALSGASQLAAGHLGGVGSLGASASRSRAPFSAAAMLVIAVLASVHMVSAVPAARAVDFASTVLFSVRLRL